MMQSFKLRILSATGLAVAMSFASAALAQEQEDQVITTGSESDASEELVQETIVTTGSRIQRTNALSAVPLQVVGSLELDESGTIDLSEAITQIPGVAVGLSPQNSNNQIQNAGLSTISLRRLGDNRTLTLVNGKRAISNSGNGERVSLSTLPVGFVERTEITTGGASAIYGSDAIAGVVNIFLEDDFEGYELDLRYSTPEASGGEDRRINFQHGREFAGGKGYFFGAVSYRNEQMIRADDTRPDSILAVEWDDPATGNNSWTNELNRPGCDPNDEDRFCLVPSLSTSIPGGVFEGDAWFVNGRWFNDQSLAPSDRPAGEDFFGDFDGFNFRPGRTLQNFRESTTAAFTTSYEFSPTMTGSLTVMASDILTETQSGFETLNDDDSFGVTIAIDPDTGERVLTPEAFEIGNMSSSHPFIPPEVEETRSGSVSFDRRLVELGEQARISDRETVRIVADLTGEFNDRFDYELFATYGHFMQSQNNPNEVNFQNAQFALDIEADGNGGFQCADADARAAGCVPLDLFGEGSISAEAADYIRYNGYSTQERMQYTFGGFLTGDAFEVPAGPVKVAGGFEYRYDEQDTIGDPDGDLVGGVDGDPNTNDIFVTSFSTFPSISASTDVIEAYGEIDVPIIEDQLSFQAAARVGHYDTIGTVFSYNLGGVWQATSDLKFRGQYSRSQRAPTLTEYFSLARPDSDDLTDPCEGLNADGTGIGERETTIGVLDPSVVTANCLSEPGIQAFFADPDNAGDEFDPPGSVQGPNAGNQELTEETADTFTVGLVYQPQWADSLTFIADYYRIEIDDVITSITTQNQVDLCYAAVDFQNNPFCEPITRRSSDGEIVEVINQLQNLNSALVSGIDLTLLYETEFEGIPGEFNFDFRYSHYLDDETKFTGLGGIELTEDVLGEIENSEDEFRARIRYSLGGFRATYTATYQSGGVDSNDFTPDNDRFFEVDGVDYHNLSLSYRFGEDEQYRIYGGVNNIFDEFGPIIPSGTLSGGSRNITTDLNDVVGREFYIGTRIRF